MYLTHIIENLCPSCKEFIRCLFCCMGLDILDDLAAASVHCKQVSKINWQFE